MLFRSGVIVGAGLSSIGRARGNGTGPVATAEDNRGFDRGSGIAPVMDSPVSDVPAGVVIAVERSGSAGTVAGTLAVGAGGAKTSDEIIGNDGSGSRASTAGGVAATVAGGAAGSVAGCVAGSRVGDSRTGTSACVFAGGSGGAAANTAGFGMAIMGGTM